MINTSNSTERALPQDRYWANVDVERLPEVIVAKALKYRDRLQRDGRLDLWRRAERTYYGQDAEGGMANSTAVSFGGEQGEMIMIRVNHYASIIKGLLATAISKRLSYDPKASNNDQESASQVTLAKSLLDFYTRTCNLEGIRFDRARMALLWGEGYTGLRWNPFIGQPLTVEQRPMLDDNGKPMMEEIELPGETDPVTGEFLGVGVTQQPMMEEFIVREGDVEAHAFTPLEVIHDLDRVQTDLDWAIIPYRENVWNLIARYPEHKTQLLSLRGSTTQRWPRSAWNDTPWENNALDADTDIITVWWLYHMPCDAMPKGRHSIIAGEVVVHDGPMTLPEVPVYSLYPEREVSLARGHTSTFDLLALQECYDSIIDSELSMIDGLGMTNVIAPKGTDISPEVISKGLQLIEYATTDGSNNKPEALNLLQIPSEMGAMRDVVQRLMETLSGINSVVRGDPMPQLKSGAALALVQSLAVAYNSAFQGAVVRSDEQVASGLIQLLKMFAVNERNVEIVGQAQRGAMQKWSADKLQTIERVTVDVGNPLQDQTAGKLEIAQQLLQNNMLKSPEQYIEVLTTGRLEPVYRGVKAETDLVARENELLAEGKPVIALLTDDHALHVCEHKAVLAQEHVRMNPQAVEFVMNHIKEHSEKWTNLGQELSALTKQSIPSPAPLPPPQNSDQGAGPPGGGKLKPAGLQPPPMNPDRARPMGNASATAQNSPLMPEIAGTKQRAPQAG